jgi:hypothetical protein
VHFHEVPYDRQAKPESRRDWSVVVIVVPPTPTPRILSPPTVTRVNHEDDREHRYDETKGGHPFNFLSSTAPRRRRATDWD